MKYHKTLFFSVVFLILAAFSQYYYDINTDYFRKREVFLTLPAGKTVKILSFGFSDLVADMLYIWSIQFYSDYNLTNSHDHIEDIYNLITDVSPGYKDPYIIGSAIMAVELNKIKMAIRLLQKGAKNFKNEWIFDVDSGYYASKYLKDYKLAEKYFLKASKIEGAPDFVSRMLYHQIYMQDRLDKAWELWRAVLDNSDSDAEKHSARLHLYQIKFELDKKQLEKFLRKYRNVHGVFPEKLEGLVKYGYVRTIPKDFKGTEYKYNKGTGTIDPSEGYMWKK
ncbi:MAG: hypothetical protein ABFR75_03545 [Acidobacteriota bacterium]